VPVSSNRLVVRESAQQAKIGDVFKVHDFNYIFKVIEQVAKL